VQLRDFIPWRAFEIRTRWSPEVAAIELKKAIDQGSLIFGRGETASFVGDVRGPRKFRFRRRVGYRNSFLPIIRVAVEPAQEGGACLRVTMRLSWFALAFMTGWMIAATVAALRGLSAALAGHPGGLTALAFPLFGAVLVGVPFALEARAAEKLLHFIFEDAR
jgi:hypothetical protein